jgi:ribosomal protein S18 acetylase RimI-like enzyme
MEACRAELAYSEADLTSPAFHFQVAVSPEGGLAGFYAIEKLNDDDFELESLCVLPEYIGTGVGRALMSDAIARATQLGGLRLVIQSDPNAEAFYRSAGGEVVGERESSSIPGRMLPVVEIALNPRVG